MMAVNEDQQAGISLTEVAGGFELQLFAVMEDHTDKLGAALFGAGEHDFVEELPFAVRGTEPCRSLLPQPLEHGHRIGVGGIEFEGLLVIGDRELDLAGRHVAFAEAVPGVG